MRSLPCRWTPTISQPMSQFDAVGVMISGAITEHMNFAIQSNDHCIGLLHVSVANPSTDASVITVAQRTVLSEVSTALGSFMSVHSTTV